MAVISVLLAGVGGQGIVLASNVLMRAAELSGFDVKRSEIHGMAQRGGSVVSHVRFGDKVFSPVVPVGEGDYIVSFERMEFLRYMRYKNADTTLILNSRRIFPPTVAMGSEKYPDEAVEQYKSAFKKAVEVDGDSAAIGLGNIKVSGVAVLSNIRNFLNFPESAWETAVRESVAPHLFDINMKAINYFYTDKL